MVNLGTAPAAACPSQSSNGAEDASEPAPPNTAGGEVAVSSVVLDQVALLNVLRATMPRARGLASINNGAHHAVLLEPEPTSAARS